MTKQIERDSLSGVETTGHEWDGLKELNNPLPKWWLYIFWITVIWSVLYFVLYPAIPMGTWATTGILGNSSRATVEERLAKARERQAPFLDRIAGMGLQEVRADTELLDFALTGGRTMFNENCAPCHGAGGQGRPGGYPVLADDDWLWDGTVDGIYHTIRYGIRSDHEETRYSEMPRYGVDELLTRAEISDVAEYVLALSDQASDPDAVKRGAAIYSEQCAACHGENGKGITELGAPNLTDQVWLFGGDKESIVDTVFYARNGVMPAFAPRLDDETLKQLAIYVHDALGGGR